MLSRAPTLRALLRKPPPALRPSFQPTRSFSRLQPRAPTPSLTRPSLSIAYRALPLHLQNALPASPITSRSTTPISAQQAADAGPAPSTTQWTHFTTAYSYSSIRTFTSSRTSRLPAAAAAAAAAQTGATSPEAAQRIEEVIEVISELYGSAQDEFEMAIEETEKNTTYAADDRAAAREELDKLLEFYNGVIEGADRAVAEEVKRRVGGRIRELEQAVLRMEEDVAQGD